MTFVNTKESVGKHGYKHNVVNDVTGMNETQVDKIYKPRNVAELKEIVSKTSGRISIGGGYYSQGGQTSLENSLHIDMSGMDKHIRTYADRGQIEVSAGCTWREIQEVIDKDNLSIAIMQSYANFTVGGSLSVNVHGRYVGEGAIIKSVISLQYMDAKGNLHLVSRKRNPSMFNALIGGYGGYGIILNVVLRVVENIKVKRKCEVMPLSKYKEHFFKDVLSNPNAVFTNGILYPPAYNKVRSVTWIETNEPVTKELRLVDKNAHYLVKPVMASALSSIGVLGSLAREHIVDKIFHEPEPVHWRNYEASYDVSELQPLLESDNTYALREYFVPEDKMEEFAKYMGDIFNAYNANVLNVSIRHAKKDDESLFSWSKSDVFAFVIFYKQGRDKESQKVVDKWSRELIDVAIGLGGSYYLPYQPCATIPQFLSAYPRVNEALSIKRAVDPDNRFGNKLWDKYLTQVKEA